MKKEKECEGCPRSLVCLISYKICPCIECLVRSACSKFCYERHVVGAKFLELKPLSEEEFKKVESRNV